MGLNFIDEECMVCKKKFVEDDDIVVCETCGTPYHRECYRQVEKCINAEYHEHGWTFSEKHRKPSDILQESSTKSQQLGIDSIQGSNSKYNASEDNYDKVISVSNDILNQVNLNPNEDCSGVTLLEFYLYTKSLFSTKKFHKASKEKSKNVFNIWAFLFSEYYMVSKNMYVPAVFTFLIDFVITVPFLIWSSPDYIVNQVLDVFGSTTFNIVLAISLVLLAVFRLFIGYKTLPLYFKGCVSNIKAIKHSMERRKLSNHDFLKSLIDVRSSVNFLAILIVFMCSQIFNTYFYFLLNLFLSYLGG